MSVLMTMILAQALGTLGPDEERTLALEALPDHLRAEAGIYLLGEGGFARDRESRNGYECLVERDSGNVLAPLCYDAVGAASLLPMSSWSIMELRTIAKAAVSLPS